MALDKQFLFDILKDKWEESFNSVRMLPKDVPLEIDNFFDGQNCICSMQEEENFSSLGANALIGVGLGGISGLMYGYWDYLDEKKQRFRKGEELPDKKIIIRDALIGAGLGGVIGAGSTAIVNRMQAALDDKKATEQNKKTYDNLIEQVMKTPDNGKVMALFELKRDELTPTQRNAIQSLIKASGNNKGFRSQTRNAKIFNTQPETVTVRNPLGGTMDVLLKNAEKWGKLPK